MKKDRVALDGELGIFHRVPPAEEKEHFVIGRSCRCCPSLEIVDEYTVIVDHKRMIKGNDDCRHTRSPLVHPRS